MIGFPPLTITLFAAVTLALLWLDLTAHKSHKPVPLWNAALWSGFYIAAALAFAGWLAWRFGPEPASLFLTGYTLEKVLSVDNLIVFAAVFAYFKIPDQFQHRVLHWGIIGAVAFRFIFVAIGSGSLLLFGPVVEIIFAVIVAWSAVQIFRSLDADDAEEPDYENLAPVRWARKIWPVTPMLCDHNFFVRGDFSHAAPSKPVKIYGKTIVQGGLYATPLFICLIAVEVSDVMFAFDSVPAIIAVTRDPFLIYSAMIFAILGLRSLYFVMSALMRYMAHLEKAVVAVLFFIAAKLALSGVSALVMSHPIHISPEISLAIVLGTLALGVIASFIFPERKPA